MTLFFIILFVICLGLYPFLNCRRNKKPRSLIKLSLPAIPTVRPKTEKTLAKTEPKLTITILPPPGPEPPPIGKLRI